jgi:hypothetical protein
MAQGDRSKDLKYFDEQVKLWRRKQAIKIIEQRVVLESQTLEERSRPDDPVFLRLQAE